ncbi:sensor histidine kinase [Streptacidiphilus sp. P02-A3a]|uniref:sensor histidine kinase n=1 Tax=Streptacidiphilus sp. P02-A3a TaxID=2704468 RepID=UPI0015F7FEFE|nr:sensor histidine kinase [Streptacidiphilus sp. P02-A3a]QMU70538.1 sensor histidine kinase [Streptacidiphilus sp. P02-A3a]
MTERTSPADAGPAAEAEPGFRHELYPYAGEAEFLSGALSFIDDARAGQELVLVAVADSKEQMLRAELEGSGAADNVSFLDTAALGRNPGRLLPAWQDWISKRATEGHQVRGISESPWADRTVAEAGELHYHEWLINLAFAESPAWWLLCPYDTSALEPSVLEAAERCHPLVLHEGSHGPSSSFVDEPYVFAELGSPCDPYQELSFRTGELTAVRSRVTTCATEHGLEGARLRELLIAVTEVASNSIKYGGGRGTVRVWAEDASLVCEFHDSGHVQDPLVGRIRPTIDQTGGRGLWLVQQLCDLVQIRSTAETGTTVRLHVALG